MAEGISRRKDSHKWLVGDCSPDIVGQGDGGLVFSHYKSQLPTNKQVLRHFFNLRMGSMSKDPVTNSADVVVEKVFSIWESAKVPTVTRYWAKKKLLSLYEKWRKLEKEKGKSHVKSLQNREEFISKLESLFDIVKEDWEREIQHDRLRSSAAKEEDLKFITDQRGPRLMFLDKVDMEYSHAHARKQKRTEEEENMLIAEDNRINELLLIDDTTGEEDIEVMEEESRESDMYEDKNAKREEKVQLSVPRKIFKVRLNFKL